MPNRNINLTERSEQLIDDLVASGRFRNATEVLEEGLRLIEDRDAQEAEKLEALREAARTGLADFEAGRYVRFESPEELDRYLDELAERALAKATE
jgi:antitoxin ParD1/3/4